MFSWAYIFFILALIAAIFGFFGLAASAVDTSKILFLVALVMAIISFAMGHRPPV